jgi:hypothetical protein
MKETSDTDAAAMNTYFLRLGNVYFYGTTDLDSRCFGKLGYTKPS